MSDAETQQGTAPTEQAGIVEKRAGGQQMAINAPHLKIFPAAPAPPPPTPDGSQPQASGAQPNTSK
jgi:hypothetical protein